MKNCHLFHVGLRFRGKDTKFPRNYTYGLNHGRQLLKSHSAKPPTTKKPTGISKIWKSRSKIPSPRLGRRTTLSTLRTSNLCSRHKTMSSLLSAHYLITTKSWRRKISVPVHLSAITSQRNTCSTLYVSNTMSLTMTWRLLTKLSFMSFTPICKGIRGKEILYVLSMEHWSISSVSKRWWMSPCKMNG